MTGPQLKALIVSNGITAKAIAKALGINQNTLSTIFQKDSVPALYEYAIKYLLGVKK